MTLQDLGSTGEFIAAIATLATLVYLAAQMRQNNQLARRAASIAVMQGRSEINRFIASDPEINRIFWQGIADPDSLVQEEWNRFVNILAGLVRHYEMIYLDFVQGLLPEPVWRSQLRAMRRWLSQPGARRFIDEFADTVSTEFITALEDILEPPSKG